MDHFNDAIRQYAQHLGWTGEAALKLLLAAILGGLVGLERERRGREAGFRTNLLVCLGSTLVMLVSISFAHEQWMPDGAYNINVDPARIAYGVMTGIGFLGAGAIIKHERSIRGLTTAAGLWCVAAIGLALGMGLYVISCMATALVLLALWLLNWVEDAVPRVRFRHVVVRCPWQDGSMQEIHRFIETRGITVNNEGFERIGDLSHVDITLSVSYSDTRKYDALEADLRQNPRYQVISSKVV
jgi:putative Mg2+ transporter-C (MgtC) family protein